MNLLFLIGGVVLAILTIIVVRELFKKEKAPPVAKRPVLSTHSPKEGVQVDVLVKGSGREAISGAEVRVHYTAWLTNGVKVDSSHDRGEVFGFTMGRNEVIPGWEEGMVGMKVGEVRKFTISPENAYGPKGKANVPPNSTIVFEVELIKAI